MIAALFAGLLAVGCSSPEEPVRPFDVAQQKLDEFISDWTWVAGFTVSPHGITVVSGFPPEKRHLSFTTGTFGSPIKWPAHPQMVRGSEFPLTESVERARESAAQCDDWVTVQVSALAGSAVVTRTTCRVDDQDRHTVLLNDQTLPTLDDPISTEALQTLWSEFGTAGLDKRLLRVEIDRAADEASVFFVGTEWKRMYEWSRGLREPNSRVGSHQTPTVVVPRNRTTPLGAVPVERVTTALDQALASLDDPALAERITVEPTNDGDGIQLVLTALDYTPIATVPVG